MENVQKLIAALLNQEKEDEIRLRLMGSGGFGENSGTKILSGGGRLTADIPISERLIISPYFGGGGATGSVATDEGRKKIKNFSPEFGVNAEWKF